MILATRGNNNDLLAKITLPEDNTNALTSKYELYLPFGSDLTEEIKEVISLRTEKRTGKRRK
jgi:hypothetical protein